MTTQTMTSSAVMNGAKISGLQILTLVLCFLVVAADGFDVAAAGYVAPLLKREWALAPPQLAPIFGAGLFGLAIGSFIFGPMADRIGRRRVIVLSMLLFAAGSIACGYADSVQSLAVLRFLTGLGLGGAMPAALTLSSEFAPERNRALLVTLMFCGFTLGLAFGGGIAALLIPRFGWPGVFFFGGAVPLALVPLIWFLMPESLRFMAGKPKYEAEARAVLRRLTGRDDVRLEAVVPEERGTTAAKASVLATLFNAHYRAGTLLLWLAFFCTLWVYYQVSSWLPTVITDSGIAVTEAAAIGAMMPIGGTLGSLINARLMDHYNPFFVLTCSYAVAALSIVLTGAAIAHPGWLYVAVFCIGLGLSGAQTGANVLVSGFYTTAARATGVSWALAVGRVGSIVGSVSGGALLAAIASKQTAFVVFAVPAVIAGCAMLVTGRLYKEGK
ncbi:MFS transporter, AAHS family, 4-hydroxybenzoate transporter [Duganella sp. CF402]|uniref:MFS transporter n=1 Tax=unclassified Duganella TaxID=2636909 RepID=UPI0008C4E689|nr:MULTISPECIES: MFS transporter [unclassified Duganella]RZT08845.1 AAHS family 4-hydroxybenzoate transporter-like MFS transporter [Duganella sp. BK701]SEL79722.1 MFS transporter, AAHS family, 4-hydroxybenzoate transporter [Duganella sp. CF402]